MPARSSLISHPTEVCSKDYIDLQALKELPDSFKWAPLENLNRVLGSESESESESVPIVDLHDSNAQHVVGLACKSWGAFQVINHGISKHLLDKIEAFGKSLFSLPVKQKLKAARSHNGITGYGPARISNFFPKKFWSEGFTIVGSPQEHARQLWPNDYEMYCAIIEEYQNEMKILAKKLMWLILGSLGISTQDMRWDASPNGADPFRGASGAIQLNSYPACPDPSHAMGLAAHTDSTLLTILYQSNTSGLQVLNEPGQPWVTVPPISGGLVVNVGDLLHILSNGLYKSVYHRAVVNEAQHRLSVAYLYGPGLDIRVQPVPKLCDARRPSLYKSVTWREYLDIKGKHLERTLSLLCLDNNLSNHDDNQSNSQCENDSSNNALITGRLRRVDKTQSIQPDSNAKIIAGFA